MQRRLVVVGGPVRVQQRRRLWTGIVTLATSSATAATSAVGVDSCHNSVLQWPLLALSLRWENTVAAAPALQRRSGYRYATTCTRPSRGMGRHCSTSAKGRGNATTAAHIRRSPIVASVGSVVFKFDGVPGVKRSPFGGRASHNDAAESSRRRVLLLHPVVAAN